jgi:hypothetical protein
MRAFAIGLISQRAIEKNKDLDKAALTRGIVRSKPASSATELYILAELQARLAPWLYRKPASKAGLLASAALRAPSDREDQGANVSGEWLDAATKDIRDALESKKRSMRFLLREPLLYYYVEQENAQQFTAVGQHFQGMKRTLDAQLKAGKITDAVNTTRSAELLHDLETAKVQLRHHLMMEMLNGYFTSKEQASVPLTAPAVRTSPEIWMPPAAPALPENPYASTEAAIKFGGLSEKCNRLVGNIHANGGAGGHEVLAGLTPQLMQVREDHNQAIQTMLTRLQSKGALEVPDAAESKVAPESAAESKVAWGVDPAGLQAWELGERINDFASRVMGIRDQVDRMAWGLAFLGTDCPRLINDIIRGPGQHADALLQRFEARLTEVLNTQPKSAMHEDVCQVLEVYFGTGPNVTKPQAPKFSGLADTVLSRQIDFLMRVTSQMEQTMHGRFLEDLLNTIRVGGTTERDQLLDYFDFKLKELAKRTKDPQMKAAVAAMQSEFSSVASGR